MIEYQQSGWLSAKAQHFLYAIWKNNPKEVLWGGVCEMDQFFSC